MPKLPKPTVKLTNDQVSIHQRQLSELLNPQIEIKRKQAIALSPEVNEKDIIDMSKLPPDLLDQITLNGLEKELSNIHPKTKITFYKKGDKIKQFVSFVRKYGKPQPYTMSRGVLTAILILFTVYLNAQSISASIGYTSEGTTASMLTASYLKHELYFKSVQDRVDCDKVPIGYKEKHEYSFGYGYKIHDNVTLFAGVGQTQTFTVIADESLNGWHKGLKMNCFEYGFRYDIVHLPRIDIGLTALMNNYTGLNSMVTLRYNFCR